MRLVAAGSEVAVPPAGPEGLAPIPLLALGGCDGLVSSLPYGSLNLFYHIFQRCQRGFTVFSARRETAVKKMTAAGDPTVVRGDVTQRFSVFSTGRYERTAGRKR